MQLVSKFLVSVTLLATSIANADSWQFKKELNSESFNFEKTTITRVIDTLENQQYPKYSLIVTVDGKDVANFRNLTFSNIAAFDKGNYLLGVSNSGLSTFAYFIMDSSGNLLRTENHSKSAFKYCRWSVTTNRTWVDDEAMEIKEEYKTIPNEWDPKNPYVFLTSVTIKGCEGNDVEIWAQ